MSDPENTIQVQGPFLATKPEMGRSGGNQDMFTVDRTFKACGIRNLFGH